MGTNMKAFIPSVIAGVLLFCSTSVAVYAEDLSDPVPQEYAVDEAHDIEPAEDADASKDPEYLAGTNDPISNDSLSEGSYVYDVLNNEITIKKYSGTESSIVIPEYIGGYKVTTIGASAFRNCTSIQTVTTPDSLTKIDKAAFAGCVNLREFIMLSGESQTMDVVIAEGAFSGCKLLENVKLADSVIELGDKCFYGCESLDSIVLPKRLKKLGVLMFYRTNIQSIVIPKTVGNCFQYEYEGTFTGAKKLETVIFEDGTERIPSVVLAHCGSVKYITIPDTVRTIGTYAFYKCSALETVYLNHSVSIQSYAFAGCGLLSEFVMDKGNSEWTYGIGDNVFENCHSLQIVSLPENVTSLGSKCFYNCKNLKSLELPKNLSSLGGGCLCGTGIETIHIPSKTNLSVVSSCSTGVSGQYAFYNGLGGMRELRNVIFDDGWLKIPYSVLEASTVKNIIIPDSVRTIESAAFISCSNLESIKLPGVECIRSQALKDCSSLESIWLSKSILTVEESVFDGCSNLRDVYYEGSENEWNNFITSVLPNSGNDDFLNATVHFNSSITSSYSINNKYVGTFAYQSMSQNKSKTYDYEFDFDDFFVSSYNYQHSIAKMSLRVAMAAMDPDEVAGSSEAGKYIKPLMDDLDFVNTSICYPNPNGNTIGTAIGCKTIANENEEDTLILMAIRGGGYKNEWAGNANVGDANHSVIYDNHYGFDLAADQALERLKEFVSTTAPSGNLKIWICGYSRAAAVANLVAAKLDDGVNGINVEPDHVYAYCFECPQNTINDYASDGKYSNIKSVVNMVDVVPLVAPAAPGWEYRRFGTTLYIPNALYTTEYSDMEKDMEEEYIKILGADYDEDLFYSELVRSSDMTGVIDTTNNIRLVSNLARLLQNPVYYMEKCQGSMWDIMMTMNSEEGFNAMDYIPGFLSELILRSTFAPVSSRVFGFSTLVSAADRLLTNGSRTLVTNHYPELLLAWLDSLSGDELRTTIDYHIVYVNCPVNVVIHDPVKGVVGRIVNNETQLVENGVAAFVDDDGQKIIALPDGNNYSLQIMATDDGDFTYTVEEYAAGEIEPHKTTAYTNIEIEYGDCFVSKVGDVLTLCDRDGVMIAPNMTALDDDVASYTISLDAEGNGHVEGGGLYKMATFCSLRAIPDTGNLFAGWRIGEEIVSEEEEYRFLVHRNEAITAVFEKDPYYHEGFYIKGLSEEGYTYTGTAIKPVFGVYDHEYRLKEKTDYTLTITKNVNVTNEALITVVGRGNYGGRETATFKITPKSLQDEEITVDEIPSALCNNRNQTPLPVVTFGKRRLVNKTDYTVEYYKDAACENGQVVPKEAGTYYVKVTGKGNFKDHVIREFVIVPSNKKMVSKLTVTRVPDQVYIGTPITPALTIKDGAKALVVNQHYRIVQYDDNTEIGNASVVIEGLGDYVGTRTIPFKITGFMLNRARITGFATAYDYDGSPKKQTNLALSGVIKTGKPAENLKGIEKEAYDELSEAQKRGYDYTIAYANNIEVGTATMTLAGVNRCTGTVTKTYKINGIAMSRVTVAGLQTAFTYDGTPKTQNALTLSYKVGTKTTPVVYKTQAEYDSLTPEAQKQVWCIVSYAKNTDAGSATMTLTGIRNLTGKVTRTFRINPYDIAKDPDHLFNVSLDPASYPYSKSGVKPLPAVTFTVNGTPRTLVAGTDYTLAYQSNLAVNDGTGRVKPTIRLTGKGNFKGVNSATTFKITAADMQTNGIKVLVNDVEYRNRTGNWKSAVSLVDPDGKKLVANVDYDARNIVYKYKDTGVVVGDKDIAQPDRVIQVRVNAKNTTYSGYVEGEYRILAAGHDISKLTVTVDPKIYTGRAIKLTPADIKWKQGAKVLNDVTIEIDESTYKNNTAKGRATVVVRGTGDYGGEKTITFNIGVRTFLWWWR